MDTLEIPVDLSLEERAPFNIAGFNNLRPHEKQLATRFESALQRSKSYLFALTDQLLDQYPERKWSILIGDDTSARLPTHFIREVFKQQGIEIPTRYVHAGRSVRNRTPQSPYEEYARDISPESPADTKALVITDTTSTGETAEFIQSVLMNCGYNTVDFGVIAALVPIPMNTIHAYVGGIGYKAHDSVVQTFEIIEKLNLLRRVLKKTTPFAIKRLVMKILPTIDRFSTHQLTNLSQDKYDKNPHGKRTDDNQFKRLPNYCYSRMK